jgi:hypothetical protein
MPSDRPRTLTDDTLAHLAADIEESGPHIVALWPWDVAVALLAEVRASRDARTLSSPPGSREPGAGPCECGQPIGTGCCRRCVAVDEAAPAPPTTPAPETPAPEGTLRCRDWDCVRPEGHDGWHENHAGWKFSDPPAAAPAKETT